MRTLLSLAIAAAFSASASAAIITDGVRDAGYGSALSVQTVQTQFGDNFSEWNAGYAVVEGGHLKLMLTGNLENNFNKLEIFIDSKAGGQSTFTSAGNDGSGNIDGMVFDTGFTADYHLIARRGAGKFDLDFADLGAATFGFYEDVLNAGDSGSGNTGTVPTAGVGANSVGIGVGYDGSNVAGIGGGDQALTPAEITAAQAVTTGLELSIALSDLGYAGGDINIMVGQNGGSHDFWSNQFLGGVPGPQGNLGNAPLAIDFTTIADNQFFTLAIPEPSTALLAGVALVGLAARRRS